MEAISLTASADRAVDLHWMGAALDLARQAVSLGEVPVGAVLLDPEGAPIARVHNAPIHTCDPTAHAEILALRLGAQERNNYRLAGCTLYVTLEPCAMCFGAIVQARLARVVYGAADAKAGVIESHLQLPENAPANHHLQWEGGVLAAESAALLRDFFRARRGK
jgi:tRNA(adenine34) deaminase